MIARRKRFGCDVRCERRVRAPGASAGCERRVRALKNPALCRAGLACVACRLRHGHHKAMVNGVVSAYFYYA